MISNSIRWSLAGNDVDWMMKTSEPRTFSWIWTKISMSAKRRTTALVSGRRRQLAISFARAGLELPATSLIEPFLADIQASPPGLLDTMFSISGYPQKRRVSTSEVISRTWLGWQPVASGFPAQNRRSGTISLMGAIAQGAHAERIRGGGRPVRDSRRRGPPFPARGRGRGPPPRL